MQLTEIQRNRLDCIKQKFESQALFIDGQRNSRGDVVSTMLEIDKNNISENIKYNYGDITFNEYGDVLAIPETFADTFKSKPKKNKIHGWWYKLTRQRAKPVL